MVEFKKFVLGKLLNVSGTHSMDAGKVKFVANGDAEFIGRTSTNYGVQGLVDSDQMPFEANAANTITISQVGTIVAQYRDTPYFTSQNIAKLSADFLTSKVALYLCVVINSWLQAAGFVGYSTVKLKDIKQQEIELPVTSTGDPDFAYMARRIDELEAQRIDELNAYLKVSGLDNTVLTDEEKDALTKKVGWKKFKVSKFFDIHPTKSYKLTNRELLSNEGKTPVLTNTSTNNGIGGWSKLDPTEDQLMITFSDTTTGANTMFVQDKPFIGYSHVQGMFPKPIHHWNKKELLYVITNLRAAAGDGWSYATKFNRKIVANLDFLLPVTSTGAIDFAYMQHYITAIEKQSIKGVIAYKDKVIATTKKVVNGNV